MRIKLRTRRYVLMLESLIFPNTLKLVKILLSPRILRSNLLKKLPDVQFALRLRGFVRSGRSMQCKMPRRLLASISTLLRRISRRRKRRKGLRRITRRIRRARNLSNPNPLSNQSFKILMRILKLFSVSRTILKATERFPVL